MPKEVVYSENACAQQTLPSVSNRPDLGDIAGVKVQNGKGLCLAQVSCILMYICLCGSAHTSGYVVNGFSSMAVH